MNTPNDGANEFRPGDVWRTPRGFLHRVMYLDDVGFAILRKGSDGMGRKFKRRWANVANWVRISGGGAK